MILDYQYSKSWKVFSLYTFDYMLLNVIDHMAQILTMKVQTCRGLYGAQALSSWSRIRIIARSSKRNCLW